MFRLITWNLNGRRACIPAQVAALEARAPDLVALQEVTRTSAPRLHAALRDAGLRYSIDSFSLAPSAFVPAGPRRYGLLIASRHPVTAESPDRFEVPWPERVLSVVASVEGHDVEVHGTHVPPGASNGWIKVRHLDGLRRGLMRPADRPRVLCGDFNTPQVELPTGEVVTWAQRQRGDGSWRVVARLRGGAGAAWDAAERAILTGLGVHGIVDVFRHLHGYQVGEASWMLHRLGTVVGRRFDHVLASESLAPTRCEYLHYVREEGLSDHSALEADFDWPPPPM